MPLGQGGRSCAGEEAELAPGVGVGGVCVPSWVTLGSSMWGLKLFGEGGKKLGWARPLLERTSSAPEASAGVGTGSV